MRQKIIIILGMSLGIGKIVSAQSDINDLVRYSGIQYQGTARSTGVGNAMGAVGADFGAIGINPAGLGLYQRSEFSATLGYDEATANGNYLGTNTPSTSAPNLNVGNVGIVIANNKKKRGKDVSSGWLNVNWGIGFTRTNNFNTSTVIEGTNNNNSILAYYKESANSLGVGPSALYFNYENPNTYNPYYGNLGQLAFGNYLLNPSPGADTTKYVDATSADSKISVYQRDVIQTSGAMNNISISVAGNYLGKLYLGATVNVPTVSYTLNRTFTEYNNIKDTTTQYISSTLSQTLTTTGVGINATIGAMYRFNDMFRLGLSVQLPTLYFLTHVSAVSINGNTVANGSITDTASQPNGFQYTIVTPARTTLSGAVFFNQNGFLSVDYEYVDYAAARVNGTSYVDLDQTVQNQLQGVNTLRVGCEYRIQNFSLRAGYDYISSPYKSGLENDNFTDTYNILSFGVGFRANKMGLDLTYQLITNNSTYTPYTLTDPADIAQYGNAPSANVTIARSNLMLTYTTRF